MTRFFGNQGPTGACDDRAHAGRPNPGVGATGTYMKEHITFVKMVAYRDTSMFHHHLFQKNMTKLRAGADFIDEKSQ